MPEEVDFVLNVLEKLAKRYGKRDALLGIEPVNEPITEPMWTVMDVPRRYPAADPDLASGSAPNTMSFLQKFYTDAFDRIKPHLKEGACVVFHDAFRLKDWKEFLTQDRFKGNVILDTHQYLMMAEAMGCEQSLEAYLDHIQNTFAKNIAEVQEYVPVIAGEWCIFNSLAVGKDTRGGQTGLSGIDYSDSRFVSDEEKKEIYLALAKAHLDAWSKGSGYFYWTYKMLLDPVNDPAWRGWDIWDLAKSIDLGWFPEHV